MNQREEILALFNDQQPGRPPCFSGLIHVTAEGLASAGLKLHEVHTDAAKLAAAAASTNKSTGFPSAVVPLDLCVEAEAFGTKVDFHIDALHPVFPGPSQFLFDNCEAVKTQIPREGRLPLVCEAIRLLKEDIGREVVIGAFVPGPFTLLSLLIKPEVLMLDLKRDPASVHTALDSLANLLTESAMAYHQAGADMLTVHEMGGSPGVLGPKRFESFVLPPLQKLIASLPKPRVLSVCGNTNNAMHMLAKAGADAIHVDQLNDLAASRAALPDSLLFGNIDPVGVLANGTESDVQKAVSAAITSGVDAIWPGCDLYPSTPPGNLRAMLAAAQSR
jgi:MtaA/CmuA family methyltransferase